MVINIDKLRKLQKVLEEFEDILNNIEILRQACEIGLINEEYKKVVTFLEDEGLPVTKPYAHALLGHSDFIEPPEPVNGKI